MTRFEREDLLEPAAAWGERRSVRFQEVDAAGVVFYARVFDYFHDAYVSFLREASLPLEDAVRTRSWLAPLSHAEADYMRPLRFGQEITVSLVRARLAETEYRIGYRIETAEGVACTGQTVHVSVDPATARRAPVPEALGQAVSRLAERP